MLIRETKNFTHGTVTRIESQSTPVDALTLNNNWLSRGDRVELRRGLAILGDQNVGLGKITGLFTAHMVDGTEVEFRSRGQKVEYYDSVTDTWLEVGGAGANILGAAASGEDVSFAEYISLAGAQLWVSSPNSSIFKIMVANPASYLDMYDSARNYKGYIKIFFSRMTLWDKNDSNGRRDPTSLYKSKIDTRAYTTITGESFTQATDGARTNFTKTLASVSGKRTCFGVLVKADGVIVATETSPGGLGTLSGTGVSGTINYTTGALSVDFTAAPGGAVVLTIEYQYEDSTAAGIADFRYSGTRLAGEGLVLLQYTGGKIRNVNIFDEIEYVDHEKNTYSVELTADDTNAKNVVFREKGGSPSLRGSLATADGIYSVYDADENDPQITLTTYNPNNAKVEPRSISKNLDLANYRFDTAVIFETGDFILVACRHKDFTTNQTMLAYSRLWKTWDFLDYYATAMSLLNGVLLLGDSTQNNVYQAFSGMDDDNSTISNEAELGWDNDDRPGWLKKTKVFEIEGYIGPNQTINFYVTTDNSTFGATVGSVNGQDSDVDKTQSVNVGAQTIGRSEIGGGGGEITAYHFIKQIKLQLDKYEVKKFRWQATGIGYAAITKVRWRDIRLKSQKVNSRYRQTTT